MQRLGSLVVVGIALISLVVIGCTRANPEYCDTSTPCTEGVCDIDGVKVIDGVSKANTCLELDCVTVGDECLAGDTLLRCDSETNELITDSCDGFGCDGGRDACNECRPEMVVCEEDLSGTPTLTACNRDGTILDQRSCFLGCRPTGAECIDVDPSNGLETDLDYIDNNPATIVDLVLEDGYTVNSDGTIRDDNGTALANLDTRSAPQGSAKPIRVFRVRSLTITGTVIIVGSTEAVAFVADGDIEIDGTLLVRAGDITNRFMDCFGDPAGGNGSDRPGSGGGGFGTLGLPGGDADERVGGLGGSSHGTVELIPLVGGCGSNNTFSTNSRGGGALQLVSRSKISLTSIGRLGALGEGGSSVSIDAFGNIATGGGSGGALLLEAPIVEIADDAFISANGGGGGGGCANDMGENGRLSTVPAQGANCVESAIGSGGNGAAFTNATAGESVGGTDSSGGGGGGGAGRIRINTGTGTLSAPNRITPGPTIGPLSRR